jgi:hypothetical protein
VPTHPTWPYVLVRIRTLVLGWLARAILGNVAFWVVTLASPDESPVAGGMVGPLLIGSHSGAILIQFNMARSAASGNFELEVCLPCGPTSRSKDVMGVAALVKTTLRFGALSDLGFGHLLLLTTAVLHGANLCCYVRPSVCLAEAVHLCPCLQLDKKCCFHCW